MIETSFMPNGSDRVPDVLARTLKTRGWSDLTPVQRAVLEVDPPTRDMLVTAPTGSGKTVAYGLALARRLLAPEAVPPSHACRAMIITPTRELAMQVAAEIGWLYGETQVRVGCLCGGVEIQSERAALRRGLEIVVGTPGRLHGHLLRRSLSLARIECAILDEADDMLDLGFRADLEALLGAMPGDRQTLMFTATVTPRIEGLAHGYQREAVRLDLGAPAPGHSDIAYQAMPVASIDVENAIVNVLRYHEAAAALVFCNRRTRVEELAAHLAQAGFRTAALSGALDQDLRTAAIAAMRSGSARVCVATDVAARGLDLPNCTLVVHADLPRDRATLLHRSGRTGRAGRRGTAVLMVPHAAKRRADALIGQSGIAMAWVTPPRRRDIEQRDCERICALPTLAQPLSETEQKIASMLFSAYGPEQIAAALWRHWNASRPEPRVLSGMQGPAAIWFSVDRGRAHGATIGKLLPLIARVGRISRKEIGRVWLFENETRFEIRGEAVERFAAAVEDYLGAELVIRSLGETASRRASAAQPVVPPPVGLVGAALPPGELPAPPAHESDARL